ncbi:MAG: carbohydrate ABC transporter permease [Chloroflexi bacterium]|nr:carbohydrate ABC transporter permease [Chloroflexota bacterium]
MGRIIRRVITTTIVYLLMVAGAVIFIMPFLWMLSTSLKDPKQIFAYPPVWIPNPIHWDNYIQGWFGNPLMPFTLFLRNTLIITINNMIGNLVSCSLVAYGFARLHGRGKNVLFLLVLATMMVPSEVTLIPTYILFTKLQWVNTFLPLTVPAWFGWPFFIFLLRQFFLTLPTELDDAARIDGCSTWGILFRIILPLSKPALATVAIFAFIGNWNNFLPQLIYLHDRDKITLAVGLNMFLGQYTTQFHLLMADSVISLIPILVIFFLAQRIFVQGITFTGLRG